MAGVEEAFTWSEFGIEFGLDGEAGGEEVMVVTDFGGLESDIWIILLARDGGGGRGVDVLLPGL